jgi:seryl-tRNA synthetase
MEDRTVAPDNNRASSDEQEQDTASGPDSPFNTFWDEAQRRLPPALADQLRQGRDAIEKGVGAVQAQIERRAAQADVDALTRRIDQLSRQVEELTARQKANEPAPKRRTKAAATKDDAKPAAKRRTKKQDAGTEPTE